ncbi:MAG: glycosyltransferase, partial [bacterium]|nr:glycosyltransferase [bacterium]
MDALVSVVIPAYNRANRIINALKSVQGQTYANWEIVVVDDGSTDETVKIVTDYAGREKRIRLIRHERNRGAQAARNTGIKAAQGEWVAFLDSDDEWLPASLALRMAVARRDNVKVVHSNAYIQHEGKPREIYYSPAWSGKIYRKLLVKDGPTFPSLLLKKETLEKIGYLDEKIKAFQEWDTSIRLAKYFNFGFESEPTFIYDYRTENAISRDNLRGAIGYEQNVTKHFMEIVAFAGFEAVSYHYGVAARWYRNGNDFENARRCSILARVFKLFSFTMVLEKIRYVASRIKAMVIRNVINRLHTNTITVHELPGAIKSSFITREGVIYAGMGESVVRSLDNGLTWSSPLKSWTGAYSIYAVHVAKTGYIFASPKGPGVSNSEKGLWRSVDGGNTWDRVIDLSYGDNTICIWPLAEDNEGRIFAGTYLDGSENYLGTGNIYRSVDSGITWQKVYEDNRKRIHIHNIQIDERSGIIYACYGDSEHGIIRSINHGESWEKILPDLPQMVGICVTSLYRFLGTDGNGVKGKLFRTKDDINAELVFDTHLPIDNYWLISDKVTGRIYACFVDYGSS